MVRWHSLSSSSTTPSSPVTSQFCSWNSKLKSFSSLSLPFKFTSSFLTLTSLTKNHLSVKRASAEYLDQHRFAPSEDSSYTMSSPSLVPRLMELGHVVFFWHSIYKGKAALTVTPRPPEFVVLESGAYKVSKDGYLLLQFAPAIGVRQYDWTRKQVFSLFVPEMGNLICLGMRESCEFFHDPFKGNSDEGKVRKVLKVEPLPDGSGHFFHLTVQNIYIPVTTAEFAVFNTLFNYIMPYLLGWHTFANSIGPDGANHANNGNPRYGGDFEWSR